jgi:hypothetical protein
MFMAEPLNLQKNVVKQHTVPHFLLRNFSSTGRGKHRRLHAFDKAINLSGVKFHRGYLHQTEQHIPPNVPPYECRFWGMSVDVRIQARAGRRRL